MRREESRRGRERRGRGDKKRSKERLSIVVYNYKLARIRFDGLLKFYSFEQDIPRQGNCYYKTWTFR